MNVFDTLPDDMVGEIVLQTAECDRLSLFFVCKRFGTFIDKALNRQTISDRKCFTRICERGNYLAVVRFGQDSKTSRYARNWQNDGVKAAASHRRTHLVEYFLKRKHINLGSAIIGACMGGDIVLYQKLECLSHIPYTDAIRYAAFYGGVEVVMYLLRDPASIRIYGRPALISALGGHEKTIEKLLSILTIRNNAVRAFIPACRGGALSYLDIQDLPFLTPADLDNALCSACMGGQLAIAKELVKRGATDYQGALEASCTAAQVDCAKYMMSFDTVVYCDGILVITATGGSAEIFDLIKDKAYTSLGYSVAYIRAVEAENLDFVKALNAHHIYSTRDHSRMLYVAATVGNLEIVEYVLGLGANNYTHALMGALMEKQYDIAELMVELGADINSVDERLYRDFRDHATSLPS